MSDSPNPGSTEPALSVGGISAAVAAVITLLVAFGVHLTDGQTEAILGVVAVLGPIAAAVVTRAKVFSPATVYKKLGQ